MALAYLMVVANQSGTQVHLIDADHQDQGTLCGYRFRSNSNVGCYAMIGPESVADTFACRECRDHAKG